jgi:hypothetical protein
VCMMRAFGGAASLALTSGSTIDGLGGASPDVGRQKLSISDDRAHRPSSFYNIYARRSKICTRKLAGIGTTI